MEDQAEELLRIKAILKEHPKGLTIEEISKKLPLNRTSTAKYLNTLLISGQAEMRTFGRAKVFTLSQRVPLSNMFNLSSDLLLVLDHELFVNQVNEPLLKVFNIPREAIIGVRIDHSQLLPYLTGSTLSLIKEAIAGTEHTIIDRIEINNREYFFRIKITPVVFDQGGQGLTIFFEDITELKQYQQHLEQLVDARTKELITTNEKLLLEIEERQKSRIALEQNERKYRELVENANSIILRINNLGIITFFNEFAETFFGYSEADMLGKNIIGTIIPSKTNTTASPADQIQEFLAPKGSQPFNEVECIRQNGERVWVAWTNKTVTDNTGTPVEFLIVGINITDRKLVEGALRQVNTKLNLVSSIVRHDVLNKLTIIYGILSLLKETIKEPTQMEYINQAENAALVIKRQIEFTRDYKDMGIQTADWQSVSTSIRLALANRSFNDISIELPPDTVEIFADPWLTKVFFNLIDNILRYAKKATKISISYQESPEGLDIIFMDNGLGIPVEEKEKIFERGYGKSNGYGLFIAREILAITGLTIRETGTFGSGARFEINVPKPSYRIKKE